MSKENDILTVPVDTKLSNLVRMIATTRRSYFPVVRKDGSLYGVFSVDDVRQFLYDETAGELAVAQDLATPRPICVQPSENLNSVMSKFAIKNIDELPIVDDEDKTKLIGMLRRKDVISAYNHRLMEVTSERE